MLHVPPTNMQSCIDQRHINMLRSVSTSLAEAASHQILPLCRNCVRVGRESDGVLCLGCVDMAETALVDNTDANLG